MLLKEFVYSFDLNRRQLGEIIYILVNTKLENSLYYRYAKILNTKSIRKPKLSLMAIFHFLFHEFAILPIEFNCYR